MVKKYEQLFKKISISDLLFAVGLIAIAVLYIYKIPLDIKADDEAFYLTIPKRLLDGDVL